MRPFCNVKTPFHDCLHAGRCACAASRSAVKAAHTTHGGAIRWKKFTNPPGRGDIFREKRGRRYKQLRRKAGSPPQQAPICAYLRLSGVNGEDYINEGTRLSSPEGLAPRITKNAAHGLRGIFVNSL